jgi:mitochondrial fission protein ELM1
LSKSCSAEIWLLLTPKPGDNNQSIALATCIGLPYVVKQLDWTAGEHEERAVSDAFLNDTPKAANDRRRLGLIEPWPAAVICCGRRTERFALWIKAQSGCSTKVLKIGRAGRSIARYDLLVATPHFPIPPLPNVIQTAFPPMLKVNPVNLVRRQCPIVPGSLPPVPKPWFLILLGGEVKQFRPSGPALKKAAQKVQDAADRAGGSVVISTSRRTPETMLSATVDGLTKTPYVYRWSTPSAAENPYAQLLKESAAAFVTADSTSMIVDASYCGTPTFVIELPKRFNLRTWWDLNVFMSLMAVARWCGRFAGRTVEEYVYRVLSWLHRWRIARFPKDISRLHSSLYSFDLARPISGFNPACTPMHFPGRPHTVVTSQLNDVAACCRALLGLELPNPPRFAGECPASPGAGGEG